MENVEIQQALPRMRRPATLSLLVYTSLHDLLPALDPFQPPFLSLDLAQGERRRLSELEQVEMGRRRFLIGVARRVSRFLRYAAQPRK